MIQPKLRLAGYTLGSIQGRKELNGGIVARETTYPDTGCKRAKTLGYYGDCIHCPFEECFELGENIYRKHITKKRNNEIKEAWLNGVPVTTIMTKYHVSSDTVQSIIES